MPHQPVGPLALRPYQQVAVRELPRAAAAENGRATCVMPCGTGKTIVAATIARTAGARTVMFMPTVNLIAQTWRVFTSSSGRPGVPTIAVCARRGITTNATASYTDGGQADVDDVSLPDDIEATTDPEFLTQWLTANPACTVLCSYTSAWVAGEAIRATGGRWDTAILDEADCTAGIDGKHWALPLDAEQMPAAARYCLTATPRTVVAATPVGDDEVLPTVTMTDTGIYGPILRPLTWRQAITDKWLSDYRIAIVGVSKHDVRALLDQVSATVNGDPIDLRTAAAQVALLRYAAAHPHVNSVLAFSNLIEHSKVWAAQWDTLAGLLTPGVNRPTGEVTCTHVDGQMSGQERADALAGLADANINDLHVVTNCRVLSRGVDVPALDAVLLAEPRTSGPDIVQILGRAMRRHPGDPNRKAVIILPVLADDRPGWNHADLAEETASRSGFFAAWQVLSTLAEEDEAMYDSLVALRGDAENPTPEPATDTGDERVEIDGSAFQAAFAAAFKLLLLRRATSSWTLLAARLRDYASRTGSSDPRPGLELNDGYPIGARVKAIRGAYQDGRLPPTLIRHYQTHIPGWSWSAQRQPRPTGTSFDEYLTAISGHIAKTRVKSIRSYETTTVNGIQLTIGLWLQKQRRRYRLLTPDQTARLITVLGPDWHKPTS